MEKKRKRITNTEANPQVQLVSSSAQVKSVKAPTDSQENLKQENPPNRPHMLFK